MKKKKMVENINNNWRVFFYELFRGCNFLLFTDTFLLEMFIRKPNYVIKNSVLLYNTFRMAFLNLIL